MFGNGKNKSETTEIRPMETIRRDPKTKITVSKKFGIIYNNNC